jgi:hypothetical protein
MRYLYSGKKKEELKMAKNKKLNPDYWLGFLSGEGWVTFFSKENNIWNKIEDKFLWMS